MNARLFTTYATIILLLEGIGALVYTKVLPAAGITPDMSINQLNITAGLVAIGAFIGLIIGYSESELEGPAAILMGGLGTAFLGICVENNRYDILAMGGATAAAMILAFAADKIIENIELYRDINFGRI